WGVVRACAVIEVVRLVVGIVLQVLLIVAGIGLLNMKGWARVLSIFYSVLMILMQIGYLVFAIALANPAVHRWQEDFNRRFPGLVAGGQSDPATNNLFAVIGSVLVILYSVVLLIMMLLPGLSAAFAGRAPAQDYAPGVGDEGEDYERRRRREGEWDY